MNKKNILIYCFAFIASASIYFFIARAVRSGNKTGENRQISVGYPKIKMNKNVLNIKDINDTTFTLGEFLQRRKSKKTAFILIDGGCSLCVNTLINWKSFLRNNSIDKDRVVFIGYGASIKKIKYSLNKVVGIDCQFFIDNSYSFGTLNNIEQDRSDKKILLVDENSRIIVQGDPLENKKISALFIKYLKS